MTRQICAVSSQPNNVRVLHNRCKTLAFTHLFGEMWNLINTLNLTPPPPTTFGPTRRKWTKDKLSFWLFSSAHRASFVLISRRRDIVKFSHDNEQSQRVCRASPLSCLRRSVNTQDDDDDAIIMSVNMLQSMTFHFDIFLASERGIRWCARWL